MKCRHRPGNNLDQRKSHFLRPRAEFQPSEFDRQLNAAITEAVDNVAITSGVLSELHDKLLLGPSVQNCEMTAPVPANAQLESWPQCNESWLRCLSKSLNPQTVLSDTPTPASNAISRSHRSRCLQQQLFSFETLGFLHNQVRCRQHRASHKSGLIHTVLFCVQLVSLNNAVRFSEWANRTLVRCQYDLLEDSTKSLIFTS